MKISVANNYEDRNSLCKKALPRLLATIHTWITEIKSNPVLILFKAFNTWLKFARGGWVQFEDDPCHAQRYSRFPMNIYFKLYLSLLSKIVRDNPFTDLDLVLANSEWSANIVKRVCMVRSLLF
jgi:hypothetical protein